MAPESTSAPAVASPSVPSGPRKRGRRPKTLEQMGLPRKVKQALEAGRTTYLKGPRPQRYSEQEKKDVILYLIYHRVYADPRQLIRRLAGCPPSEIRNGWIYRSPTAVEAAAFFDIPNSTIANWWDKRNAILTGEAKKKKQSDAEQRRADRDRKRAKAAAKRAAMIAELEAVDAEEQRALAAQLRGEQEESDLEADSDDAIDEDESEEDDR
ncbi:hypothetical protein KJ359_000182 [Pestalotiopsis sp. 9143b]|nr:hypothetical protein KJ359_000182 [Pestalotiopsis sp. 9143b]